MQELKQIKLSDAVGKKIKNIVVNSFSFAISFDDGSFCFFKEYQEWDLIIKGDIKVKYKTLIDKLNIRDDGSTFPCETSETLIGLGVLDGDKLVEDAKEIIDDYLRVQRDKRLKKYEELKKEFGI